MSAAIAVAAVAAGGGGGVDCLQKWVFPLQLKQQLLLLKLTVAVVQEGSSNFE